MPAAQRVQRGAMALELVQLSQDFGAQRALTSVSLCVRPGRIVAFLGHNGAGKTTALRIALGLQRAASGRVRVDGFDAAEHPREARARIGALVETPGFHGAWSATRNLVALARLAGLGAEDARTAAERALERVGLGDAAAKPVEAFSQGMRQRLGLAQALLGTPRYLLLDEPQNGLDPEGLADLRALLVRLAREDGLGILVSSHQLAELAHFATDVVILRRGVVVHAGAMEDLLRSGADRWTAGVRDAARARHAFARLGIAARESADRAFEFELGAHASEDVARGLLDSGAGLVRLAPDAPSLEELYLRAQHGAELPTTGATIEPARAEDAPPAERRAPPRPVLLVARYELARIFGGAGAYWLAALPVLAGAFALVRRVLDAAADSGAVEEQSVFSATRVTAFEGVGVVLSAGLPLLAVGLAGLASQSLAGEYARGTLRNVLLRPVARGQVVLGKALALAAFAVSAYLLLALAAFAGSAATLEFDDVVELLPNGARFVLTPAADLWPELARALALPVLPVVGAALVGFACGALVRGAAAGVGLALGVHLALDLGRTLVRGGALEGWLPGAHLASPFSDTSGLAYYVELARGVSSARFEFESLALVVPAAWCALSLVVASAMLVRRPIP
ncbi:MAG: ATP-binding cassette domain-containing protein [Planctomycetes bacterium]|nr:ATP-binding cassette domain-containing protein [Planctomycetota bacterium]